MPRRDEQTPDYELHIDGLVLHGFQAIDRHALATALERELTRLLGSTDAVPHLLAVGNSKDGLNLHRLDAGSFAVPHDASSTAVGVQVAQAIYQGLSGARAGSDPLQRTAAGDKRR